MPCIRPTGTNFEYLRLFEKDRCCCRESGTAAVFFWSGFGWQWGGFFEFFVWGGKADKFSTIMWKTERDFFGLRLFFFRQPAGGILLSQKEESRKSLSDFCFRRGILRPAAVGLTSFVTERSKQERCHRFDAVDGAKEKQRPLENRLIGDVNRGTALLTLRPLPALRLAAQTRDMIARAGKPPGPRTT